MRRVTLNRKVCDALAEWLKRHPNRDNAEAPLFPSERTGKTLTVPSLSRLVKAWCRQAGIRGNHGSQRQTLDYLGIDADEVREAYLREI